MTRVKICGLKDPDFVRLCAAEGADWIGFVFVEASPRYVTPEAAETLLLGVGRAVPVALLADADEALIDRVTATGIRVLQLHGQETPDRVAEIAARTGCEVWKACGVETEDDLAGAGAFTAADRLLIDAKPPKDADRTGGHGQAFDWSILKGWTATKPWILAGGLTPENVAEAIAATGAPAVDVSSGVERLRGLKDKELVRAFLRAAKEV
ncbi:phosphoribosylanthranilate isomerase [Hyphomonas jannaschiana]|uniref:N-(5'-phosphoribosyl)anthranilate isomerase n=1 Tax=Hyphomonas jannaschiana VP2 TaxID=1280952 RepID=A0A059FDZ5_9PROT|nr:phosphoribosylanthranilate isomerase [Hyphomonas jannaschiana]KCZ88738.1 N-(5'phosphoribosyl)anthranilate isomerase [Hyphomonas jannaschiana VP2]